MPRERQRWPSVTTQTVRTAAERRERLAFPASASERERQHVFSPPTLLRRVGFESSVSGLRQRQMLALPRREGSQQRVNPLLTQERVFRVA